MFDLDVLAVFLPLAGAVMAALAGHSRQDKLAAWISCGATLVSAALSGVMACQAALQGAIRTHDLGVWIESGDLRAAWSLHIDFLSAVMMALVTSVSVAVHVYATSYMREDKGMPRFMAYLSLFTFFMLMLVTSANMLQLFFGWEGVGVMSYLLIGFWFDREKANAAAIKAFLVNRVGDAGFLLGIFGCAVLFRSVEFSTIFARAPEFASSSFAFMGFHVHALTAICLLLFMGAMAKSAQVGLHTWLPDAMEGPTPVSALIHAATMVAAGVFMVVRLAPLYVEAPAALSLMAVLGAITALGAAAVAIVQVDIKRAIAWSTISQLGLMFIALGVSAFGAALFHLVTHAFFKALLFLAAGSVIHALGGEQNMHKMGGLWRQMPVTYGLMVVGVLALAGIGVDGVFGFAGFYSKEAILGAAYAQQRSIGLFCYLMGTATAFLTAFYGARIVLLTFHGYAQRKRPAHESPRMMLVPMALLALGAVFGGALLQGLFDGAAHGLVPDTVLADKHTLPLVVSFVPVFVACVGFGMAYILYHETPAWLAPIKSLGDRVYWLLVKAYYFDDLVNAAVVRPVHKLAYALWREGDGRVIDGYGPDGLAARIARLGDKARALQSGSLTGYAFAMVMGLAFLMTWVWAKG